MLLPSIETAHEVIILTLDRDSLAERYNPGVPWKGNSQGLRIVGKQAGDIVYAGNDQDRIQVRQLAIKMQEVAGKHLEIAFLDQPYTGEDAVRAAAKQGT